MLNLARSALYRNPEWCPVSLPIESSKLLHSVAHITDERNKSQLEGAFLHSLSEFIECDSLCLFRIRQDVELLEHSVSIPKRGYEKYNHFITSEDGRVWVEPNTHMMNCLLHAQVVIDDDTMQAFFPITVSGGFEYLLALYGYSASRASDKLVLGFVHVYGNFVGVLEESERDTLTGLLNRRTFDTKLEEMLSENANQLSSFKGDEKRKVSVVSSNTKKEHWVAILDIDHFKRINDSYGHIYGDEVLLLFTQIMKKVFRNTDLLFRFGGEEFVVFMLDVDKTDVMNAFNRFRREVEEYVFPQVGQVTVSIGISKIELDVHQTILLERADKALYFAKENGRNQVCEFDTLLADGLIHERKASGDVNLF